MPSHRSTRASGCFDLPFPPVSGLFPTGPINQKPPSGGHTVAVSFPNHIADLSSTTEPLGKIPSHGSRASLLGGSFDPAFRRGPGGFRAREGYTNVTPATKNARMCYLPNTHWTWSFAVVALVQTIVTLSLERYGTPPKQTSEIKTNVVVSLVTSSQIFKSKKSQTTVPLRKLSLLSSPSMVSVSSTNLCWYMMLCA